MEKKEVLKKPRVFYGYWIAIVAFLCLFIQSGCVFFAYSLFVRPLQADMGWNRGEIMAGFTIMYLIIAASSPFIGRVVDRYGAKQVISAGALIAGLGFVVLTQINNLWQFYFGYVIVGIGITGMGQVSTSAVVSNWFRKKRGLAIGIMSMGVGGGGFAIAPLVGGYLIPDFGWRVSYMALAIITWVFVIPLALLVIKAKPADMGLYPDGIEAPNTDATVQTPVYSPSGLTLKMALATPAFWLIAVTFFSSTFSHVGIIQSQAPHLEDIGFPAATAAAALGTVGLCSAIGKFSFGWLCDRILPKYACSIGIGLQIIMVIVLLNITSSSPAAVLWLYAIVFGFGVGSWLPTMSILTSSTFGLASYGAIFGMVSLAQGIGTAIGPLVAGHMYDVMNTYYWAFVIFLILYAIALPAVLIIRRPRQTQEQKAYSKNSN